MSHRAPTFPVSWTCGWFVGYHRYETEVLLHRELHATHRREYCHCATLQPVASEALEYRCERRTARELLTYAYRYSNPSMKSQLRHSRGGWAGSHYFYLFFLFERRKTKGRELLVASAHCLPILHFSHHVFFCTKPNPSLFTSEE